MPKPDGDKYAFIEPENVIHIEGKGNSTKIYLIDGETVVCPKPLEYLEDFLNDSNYVRISDTDLINISKISHYLDDNDGRFVFMSDGSKISISINNKVLLQKRLETL